MIFKPNPLLYGANENFYSTFRLAVRMKDCVDHELLSKSVARAIARYPYFSVCPERDGDDLILRYNPRPVFVFPDDRTVTLGSEQSNGHLISFGCKDNTIFLDGSHYLTDGMGVFPFLKTLLLQYVTQRYGADGISIDDIRLPDSPVDSSEHAYPFPQRVIEQGDLTISPKEPEQAYGLDPDAFDKEGLYAYHLRFSQRALMAKATSSDGSPISFLSVLLYRTLHKLDPHISKPIVAHVQHQYRAVLRAPLSHHSLVSYIPVALPPRLRSGNVEKQNTVVRGQVILMGGAEADRAAVNRLIAAFPEHASFKEKQSAMADYAQHSIEGKTFGISYVGKTDWSGMEAYLQDLHAYIGEKHTENMLIVEVMTVGEDFSLTFMQSGKGEKYLNAFIEELHALDVSASIVGEERYKLCDTLLQV